jgi:4-diphosphocytidyl-2-C-methyl-D-erythritol kinase
MYVRATASAWEVLAPAKLNLFLEVLARRDDGFHEIETLMCPIGLYDSLALADDPSGRLELTCHVKLSAGPSCEQPPVGPTNLVVRALDLLREASGTPKGASVRLVKRIPLAAGLGGGSSDAAAALAAANRAWGLNLPGRELADLAGQLGSDVPFFLTGGPAVCRGRGERIEPAAGIGSLHFVVCRPPQGLATAEVYRACLPAREARAAAPLVAALRSGHLADAGRLLHNRLQPAAAALSAWIGRLAAEFARLDAAGHAMSGSGSSYFGLFRSARHARRAAARLASRGVGSVFAVGGIG